MHIRTLDAVDKKHRLEVGGKAAVLGELLQAKHRVPPGFVITTLSEQKLTPTLSKAILTQYDKLGLDHVAVRSSGAAEDGQDQSWAGQFATFLHVQRDALLDAVHACWVSADAARVAAYANGARIGGLAVLIQKMVHSDIAGVAFSINPITHAAGEVMIEAVYGLGELLVQGLATPDNYCTDKATGRLLQAEIAERPTLLTFEGGRTIEIAVTLHLQRKPTLSAAHLKELTALVRRIEAHYGFPVDIEWAYEDDQLYLLQARPITA